MSGAVETRTETESPKRQSVLEAAATLFMAQGYGAVSMDAVAREAGVSKATLYAHFTSKDRLFATMMGEACRTKIDAVDALTEAESAGGTDIADALRAFGVRMTRFLLEPATQAIYRVVVAECVRFPELGKAFYDSGPANFLSFFSDWIGRQMQAGRLRDADPDLAAEQFIALIRGGIYMRASVGLAPAHDGPSVEQHVANVVDTFMRAFGTA